MTEKKLKQLLSLLYEYKSDNLQSLKKCDNNIAVSTLIKTHNYTVDSLITIIKYELEGIVLMPHQQEVLEQAITSLEVAEMVGKDHSKLLRDIRNYIEQLTQSKIDFSDFFTESTYKDSKGEIRPCYNVTKKGYELIVHKLTGVKGTKFTACYINKFHDIEEQKGKGLAPMLWGDGYSDGVLVYDMYDCPNCGKHYELDYEQYDYCPNCGQKINWEIDNELE